jgi:hypothetical protein
MIFGHKTRNNFVCHKRATMYSIKALNITILQMSLV